jgi:hypothetical protein
MSALTIMLVRHAEKPGGEWPGPGLTTEGMPDKKSLVIRGWQRSGAWAALFGAGLASGDYPAPSAIYAAKPEDDNGDNNASKRPYETIIPLGRRLHIKPVVDFAKGEEQDLAANLSGQTGVVLVSWEHKAIVKNLLPALFGEQKISDVPSKWDDARFDVVLRLDRAAPNAPWFFRQLFPRLLSGDSDIPL